MQKLTKGLERQAKTATNSWTKTGAKLGKIASQMANLRTSAAAYALFRGVKAATDASLDFSTHMYRVQAWTGASAGNLKKMSDEAMRLNKETKFTAINIAEGMGLLAKRDFSPEQIIKMAPAIAALATAGGDTSVPQVTMALADALSIYDEGMEKAVKYTDMMATASANAAFDMLQLVDAFGRAGGMTEAVGMDFKTTIAILGALSEKQERGARAGTRLEMSISHLFDPNKKALKALGRLGIHKRSDIFEGERLDFIRMMELFEKGGATAPDMVAIFGKKGSKVMIKLLGQLELVKSLMDKMDERGATAQGIADIMQQGITKAAAEAESSWTNMLITMGKSLEFMTIPLLKWVKGFANWMKEHPKVAQMVSVLMSLLAVVFGLVAVIGIVLGAVSGLLLAIGYLKLHIAILATVGVPLLLLVAILTIIIARFDDFKWLFFVLVEGVGNFATALFNVKDNIVEGLLWPLEKVKGLWDTIQGKLGFGDTKHELSSTATRPDQLGTSGKVTVENIIKGSIDVNDKTGGMVSAGAGGGLIPINVSPNDSYSMGGSYQ